MSGNDFASAIYSGRISHRRLQPKRREFAYSVYMFYLDLEEMPRLFAGSRLWSSTGRAPLRFRREDFIGDPSVPLDEAVRQVVQDQTGTRPDGPVRVLANVRSFGYIFNPICVYYCFDRSGERLTHVVAEVTNTPWRESFPYVFEAPADGTEIDGEAVKRLHVSPFLDMDYSYSIHATTPGDALHLSVANRRDGETHFVADLRLRRRPATNQTLRAVVRRRPAMAASVTAHIYSQALRMRLRGFRPFSHPPGGRPDRSEPTPPKGNEVA